MDLYNFETIGNAMKATIVETRLTATRTTTSATYVVVEDTEYVHQFTFPNARVSYFNINASNNTAGQTVECVPALSSGTFVSNGQALTSGTTARELQASVVYSDIPIGENVEIALLFKRSGGTASVFPNAGIILEILEWE